MSREDAIEELLYMKHIFIAESDADKALDMAIEALEENESLAKSLNDAVELIHKLQKKNEWIPCSERLPEYNESVLTWDGVCFSVEKRIPYICDDEDELIYSEWWVSDDYDEESDYYPNLRDGAAVAWMPLPSPYKENES